MASISFIKDPDEVLDFLLDWSARLESFGDTIATSEWIMPTPIAGDIVKDSDAKTAKTTTIWVSGGELNANYTLVNRIITAGGRTMDQTCVMKIRTR